MGGGSWSQTAELMVTTVTRKEAMCIKDIGHIQRLSWRPADLEAKQPRIHLKYTLELGKNAILPSYSGLQGWVASPLLPLWPLLLPLFCLAPGCTGLLVAPHTIPSQGPDLAVPLAWNTDIPMACSLASSGFCSNTPSLEKSSWTARSLRALSLPHSSSECPPLPDTVLSTVCLPDGTVSSMKAGAWVLFVAVSP